jgi:hypothetical protein
MVQLQPVPATFRLSTEVPRLIAAVHPAQALAERGLSEILDLRVVGWESERFYQVTLPGRERRIYLSLADGREDIEAERRHAEFLARSYAGETIAPVRSTEVVSSFSDEYASVNRYLPVWRVEFDRSDSLAAFVDTRTQRLATLSDSFKAAATAQFLLLHKWSWLGSLSSPVRLALLSTMLAATLAVTFVGLWIYALRWRYTSTRWNLRRVHRASGVGVSIAALLLAASGLYHLLHLGIAGDPATRYQTQPLAIRSDAIRISPVDALEAAGVSGAQTLSVVLVDGQPAYRIFTSVASSDHTQHGDHSSHKPAGARPVQRVGLVSAVDARLLKDGEQRRLLDLVRSLGLGEPQPTLTTVAGFDSEYGFAFKRMPVQRAVLDNGTAVFVDPADGAIAAVVGRADRLEGWIFGYVHKFGWMTLLVSGFWRDMATIIVALAIAVTAIAGGILYVRRKVW